MAFLRWVLNNSNKSCGWDLNVTWCLYGVNNVCVFFQQFLYGTATKHLTYNDFINKELILFSNSDNERSIPSLVDGKLTIYYDLLEHSLLLFFKLEIWFESQYVQVENRRLLYFCLLSFICWGVAAILLWRSLSWCVVAF